MPNLTYKMLLSTNDSDIIALESAYRTTDTARFLSISDGYFDYVTSTDNVHFYKVYMSDVLVGTLHLETEGEVLFMSILVFSEYRGKGIGKEALRNVQIDSFRLGFERIEVSVDEKNTASLQLFEGAGLLRISKEDELISLVYRKRRKYDVSE